MILGLIVAFFILWGVFSVIGFTTGVAIGISRDVKDAKEKKNETLHNDK